MPELGRWPTVVAWAVLAAAALAIAGEPLVKQDDGRVSAGSFGFATGYDLLGPSPWREVPAEQRRPELAKPWVIQYVADLQSARRRGERIAVPDRPVWFATDKALVDWFTATTLSELEAAPTRFRDAWTRLHADSGFDAPLLLALTSLPLFEPPLEPGSLAERHAVWMSRLVPPDDALEAARVLGSPRLALALTSQLRRAWDLGIPTSSGADHALGSRRLRDVARLINSARNWSPTEADLARDIVAEVAGDATADAPPDDHARALWLIGVDDGLTQPALRWADRLVVTPQMRPVRRTARIPRHNSPVARDLWDKFWTGSGGAMERFSRQRHAGWHSPGGLRAREPISVATNRLTVWPTDDPDAAAIVDGPGGRAHVPIEGVSYVAPGVLLIATLDLDPNASPPDARQAFAHEARVLAERLAATTSDEFPTRRMRLRLAGLASAASVFATPEIEADLRAINSHRSGPGHRPGSRLGDPVETSRSGDAPPRLTAIDTYAPGPATIAFATFVAFAGLLVALRRRSVGFVVAALSVIAGLVLVAWTYPFGSLDAAPDWLGLLLAAAGTDALARRAWPRGGVAARAGALAFLFAGIAAAVATVSEAHAPSPSVVLTRYADALAAGLTLVGIAALAPLGAALAPVVATGDAAPPRRRIRPPIIPALVCAVGLAICVLGAADIVRDDFVLRGRTSRGAVLLAPIGVAFFVACLVSVTARHRRTALTPLPLAFALLLAGSAAIQLWRPAPALDAGLDVLLRDRGAPITGIQFACVCWVLVRLVSAARGAATLRTAP